MADFFKEIVELPQDLEGLTSSVTTRFGEKVTGYAEEAIGGILNTGATFLREQASRDIDAIINEVSGVGNLLNEENGGRLDFAYKINKGEKALSYPLDLSDHAKYKEYMAIKVKFPSNSRREKLFIEEEPPLPRPTLNTGEYLANEFEGAKIGKQQKSRTDRYIIEYGKDTFIFLPMPDANLINRNEIGFNEEQMGVLANVAGSGFWEKLGNAVTDPSVRDVLGQKMITKLQSAVTGSKIGERLLKQKGLAFNPRTELLLDGVRLRTFTFEHLFAPKNYDELIHALAIIKIMKYSSLPGLTGGGNLYTYPAEYDVVFRKHNPQGLLEPSGNNNDIFCALGLYCTSVETDYTPHGVWATFANGKPVQFKMTLTFTEIEPQSRKDVIKED